MPDPNSNPTPNTEPTPNPAPPNDPASFTLPDAFKGEKSLQSFKSLDDVLKSHVELNSKLGSAVWLPKETDTPEQKAEKIAHIQKTLGRPDTADGYTVDESVIQLPPGVPPTLLNSFKSQAHQLGFSQEQFTNVLKWYNETMETSFDAMAKQTKAYEDQMRTEWGEGLFKQWSQLAHAAIKKLGGEQLAEKLALRGLGSDPDLVLIFSQIGEKFLEDNAISNDDVSNVVSATEAASQIAKIFNDPNDLYHRKFANAPGHKERVEHVFKLQQIVAASQAKS